MRWRLIAVTGGLIVVTALIVSVFIPFAWIEPREPHGFQSAGKPTIEFPELTGRVVDDAHLLSEADERELTASLKALEDKNSDRVVVVTVPSLQGHSIEEYGNRLGRYWGVFTAEKSNGALLLVAPNEHKVRIEIGRGLEGILPNNVSQEIIDKSILPHFRTGDYAAGIKDGVNALLLVLAS